MSKIFFKYKKAQEPILGKLIYYMDEHSMDFILDAKNDTFGESGLISLTINTLQIEVDLKSGRLIYPWGFFPLININEKVLDIPQRGYGDIFINNQEDDFISGVSVRFPNFEVRELCRVSQTDWIFIGNVDELQDSYSIEFAQNVIATLKNNKIVAFWFCPTNS
ncbi:hypothetical protein [Ignatzschineria sp. LJL83]